MVAIFIATVTSGNLPEMIGGLMALNVSMFIWTLRYVRHLHLCRRKAQTDKPSNRGHEMPEHTDVITPFRSDQVLMSPQ